MHARRWLCTLGCALTVASACGEDGGGNGIEDGGHSSLDGGSSDAGASDAGALDAGQQTGSDASSDSGTAPASDAGGADGGSQPDSGLSGDASVEPDSSAPGDAPTFTMIYDNVIQGTGSGCSIVYCHNNGAKHALDLNTRQSAYEQLVNVNAAGSDCKNSGLKRVVPGDPDASLLVKKLEGTAGCGDRMPKDLDALPAATIAQVRAWIAAGAKNN